MVIEYITKHGLELRMGNVIDFNLDVHSCTLSITCQDGYTCKVDQVIEAYVLDEVDHTTEELSELIDSLKDIRWSIGSTSMDYWSSEGKEAKALDKAITILENI